MQAGLVRPSTSHNGESATLIGAFGGGIIGAGVAAWRGESVWRGAVSGAVGGAIAGSVIDTGGASLGILALAGAAGGVGGGAVGRGLSGQGTTLTDVAVDATVGATLGAAFGAGGRAIGSALAKSGSAAAEGGTALLKAALVGRFALDVRRAQLWIRIPAHRLDDLLLTPKVMP
ncbi:MAG: hypothetical protein NTW74_12275 [Acidobacteria bacterium]|nr:hypothetical protein [Acidobacteriota bacterium]